MYGTNPVARIRKLDDGFMVHSMFHTIQGEGPLVGTPCIFIRFAGCNLRCFWCDTEFDEGAHLYEPSALIIELKTMLVQHNCGLVVLTGGEPMLQPLRLLIDAPELKEYAFQIETAGSVYPDGGLSAAWPNLHLTIVCSPKTPLLNQTLQYRHGPYYKYIVKAMEPVDEEGFPQHSTQHAGKRIKIYRPTNPASQRSRIFIQACDEGNSVLNANNVEYAKEICLKHGYRLSLQTHKILNLA